MITRPDSELVSRLHASPNCEARCGGRSASLLILHYTGMTSAEKAVDWLSRPESKVSAHYVVDEAGCITQMVSEDMRAWHAGISYWRGERDINSASIGIEIHNPGHAMAYPDYSEAQMAAVTALGSDIVVRNGIGRAGVLAHSDVAPSRKIDPGEKFDWKRLADAGAGLWVAPAPVDPGDQGLETGYAGPEIADAQSLLAGYGYDAPINGLLDEPTRFALRAFQLHWRPARVDGRLDRSTRVTLERLIAAAPPTLTS